MNKITNPGLKATFVKNSENGSDSNTNKYVNVLFQDNNKKLLK